MLGICPSQAGVALPFKTACCEFRTASDEGLPAMPAADTTVDPTVLAAIAIRDTGTAKCFGAYCVADDGSAKHTFLGFYEGQRRTTLEGLDSTEYIMTLDGGATYLDGYERAQDRSTFSTVHLNHADKPACNCLRILQDNRCAFFTARDVASGEELTFDYGGNYWRGREQDKI